MALEAQLSLGSLLQEAKLPEATSAAVRAACADGDDGAVLQQWCTLLADERPSLLRALQRLGVARLAERQAIANAIGKARRAGRLPAPPRPASPPGIVEAERQAEDAISAAPPSAVSALLALLEPAPDAAAARELAGAPARLLAALPTRKLHEALEPLGLPPATVRVLRGARSGTAGLRLGFFSNQLCERGTEVALYDYADYAERLLGTTSYVLYDAASRHNFEPTIAKFTARFGERVLPLGSKGDPNSLVGAKQLGAAIRAHALTHVYVIKFGAPDAPPASYFKGARVLMHAVFDGRTPHGDVFAKISPCVPGARVPVVPHIVRRAESTGPDLRAELGIPEHATVFGRYGGYDVFDILEARTAVAQVAESHPSIYFLFMNTKPVEARGEVLERPNLIYLERSMEDGRKSAFIRTCDAMLHARHSGETFGLAVAEFSAHNRPVITSSSHEHTDNGFARFHLDTLKEKGLYFTSAESLVRLLTGFDRHEMSRRDNNAYRQFEPPAVMETFRRVFLSEAPPEGVPEGEAEARRRHERLRESSQRMPCCGK